MSEPPFYFRGITAPTYTPMPDEYLDELMPVLSGAEWKVLCYLVRRTFGFKKTSDDVSINQICKGIVTKDGRLLDRGTGLSQNTVVTALRSLVEKNVIQATRHASTERGNEPTTYGLVFIDGEVITDRSTLPQKYEKGTPKNMRSPSSITAEALPQKHETQKTVNQETVNNKNIETDWKAELAATMTANNYRRWVAPLELVELVNHHAVLSAPDVGTAEYARSRLADTLTRALNVERIEIQTTKVSGP